MTWPKPLRVAVLSRDLVHSHPGGDVVMIEQETAALQRLHVTRAHNPESLTGFDLVHCYHLNFEFARKNLERAWEAGLPIVLSPVWFDNPDLGMGWKEQRLWLDRASVVVVWSRVAEAMLRQRTGWTGPAKVIPLGVSEQFLGLPSMHGREGVLSVNAREAGDQDAVLVRDACARLGLPYSVVVGRPYAELPNIYRAARVFVFARCSDRGAGTYQVGMTTMEALAAGCRVLCTVHGLGCATIPGLMPVDASDPADLDAKLLAAYQAQDIHWNYEPNRWAAQWLWERVAHLLRGAYLDARAQGRRG